MPRIVSIIQARLSSSRLPGKVLMPLGAGDATVLDQVVARAQAFSEQVVVCTSVDASDDALAAHCEARGVVCVRGPLDDVFWRYRMTLADPRVQRTEWFARVTADCPLLSVELAGALIGALDDEVDYVKARADELPLGLTIELVRRTTFESIEHEALDAPAREHVTPHLYEEAGRYRCRLVSPPRALRHPELRLTLDYEEDYEMLRRLFEREPALTAERAVEILLAEPELARLNAHCEQKVVRPAPRRA